MIDPTGYIIVSPEGSAVIDRPWFGAVAVFPTRSEARAYAAGIEEEMPSSDLPLRVIPNDGRQAEHERPPDDPRCAEFAALWEPYDVSHDRPA